MENHFSLMYIVIDRDKVFQGFQLVVWINITIKSIYKGLKLKITISWKSSIKASPIFWLNFVIFLVFSTRIEWLIKEHDPEIRNPDRRSFCRPENRLLYYLSVYTVHKTKCTTWEFMYGPYTQLIQFTYTTATDR